MKKCPKCHDYRICKLAVPHQFEVLASRIVWWGTPKPKKITATYKIMLLIIYMCSNEWSVGMTANGSML